MEAILQRRRVRSTVVEEAVPTPASASIKPVSGRRRLPIIADDDDDEQSNAAGVQTDSSSSMPRKPSLPDGRPMFRPPSSGEQRDIEAREAERLQKRQAKLRPKSRTSHRKSVQDDETHTAEDSSDDDDDARPSGQVRFFLDCALALTCVTQVIVAPTSDRTIRSLSPSSMVLRRSARPRSGRGRASVREDTPYPQRYATPPPVILTSHHVGYTPARVVAELNATVLPTANCPPTINGKPKSVLKRTRSEAQIDVSSEQHDNLAKELFPVHGGTSKRVRVCQTPLYSWH